MARACLSTDSEDALLRATHQISFHAPARRGALLEDPPVRVTFTRPDASQTEVDAFYDGADTYLSRAYCDTEGQWGWRAGGPAPADGACGEFVVRPSSLGGKLRLHTGDSRQFASDNGAWFLHIGDTYFRYMVPEETKW